MNSIANYFSPLSLYATMHMMEDFSGRNPKEILNMLKVERNFSDHTLKAYHDDLAQFNQF